MANFLSESSLLKCKATDMTLPAFEVSISKDKLDRSKPTSLGKELNLGSIY